MQLGQVICERKTNIPAVLKFLHLCFSFCFVVNNKYISATNGFKLCSLISVNTHMRSKSDGCPQRSLCLMHNQLVIVSFLQLINDCCAFTRN